MRRRAEHRARGVLADERRAARHAQVMRERLRRAAAATVDQQVHLAVEARGASGDDAGECPLLADAREDEHPAAMLVGARERAEQLARGRLAVRREPLATEEDAD